MDSPSLIRVSIASPPNRDGRLAELSTHPDDESVHQFAEIFREDGRLMIGLYRDRSDDPLKLPLGEFLEAVGRGVARLEL